MSSYIIDLSSARVYFCSLTFLLFCLPDFSRTFLIFTCVYLTMIIFIIFVTNSLLLRTCANNLIGNFFTVEIIFIHLHTLICMIQYLKILCVMCKLLGQVVIFVFKLHGYFPGRVQLYARLFVH